MTAIAIAIPVFLATMLFEWRLLLRRGDSDYRFDDTFSNLACGIGSQIWGGLTALVSWFAYTAIADSLSLVQWWRGGVTDWVFAVLAIDLSYYWFHRISHRVRLFWSFHVVHHQSESYNLSVALRQSWFGGFLSWIFYTPWLVVGLPPTALVVAKLINLLYQYWIHTRLIGQLPFGLEWIMSSPSNHRVHHGRDDRSLDTNYGGIFIVWDRIFGTYKAELEEPPYGTVSPIKAWDPVHANIEGLQKIGSLFRASTNWKDRSLAIWGPPEWSPLTQAQEEEMRDSLYGQVPDIPQATLTYVLIHFTCTTAWLLYWLSGASQANAVVDWALAASVVVGLWSWGALLGGARRQWEFLEVSRLVILGIACAISPSSTFVYGLGTIGFGLYFLIQRRFEREKGLEKASNRP